MTQEEYNSIDWNRGNTVRLQNGKEYSVRCWKKRYLLLYSKEYGKHFVVDHRIIDCRTSDYVEPVAEKVSPVAKPKEEVKNVQKPVVKSEPVVKSAPEQPKRKRKRIIINHTEKIKFN